MSLIHVFEKPKEFDVFLVVFKHKLFSFRGGNGNFGGWSLVGNPVTRVPHLPLSPQVHLLQALMLVLFTTLFPRWLIDGFQVTCSPWNHGGKISLKIQQQRNLFIEFW